MLILAYALISLPSQNIGTILEVKVGFRQNFVSLIIAGELFLFLYEESDKYANRSIFALL